MTSYKSSQTQLSAPADRVFCKLSDLNSLGALISRVPAESIPDDKRKMLDQVRITEDSISLPAGPVGEITLRMSEKVTPTLIRMTGENTPVALSLEMHITPLTESSCEALVQIDIDIPAMLRPMVSGPLQKMVDQFAGFLKAIPFE